jgi:hypothetical protein
LEKDARDDSGGGGNGGCVLVVLLGGFIFCVSLILDCFITEIK